MKIPKFVDSPYPTAQEAVPTEGELDEAMRLNAALPSDPAADLCASGQQVRPATIAHVIAEMMERAGEPRPNGDILADVLCQVLPAALTPAPQPAGEAVLVSQDALIDLIGEFGREVCYMLDDCETSGPVGEEVHTITDESLTKVSAILDRIDALPFEEPGVILGTGAMLQAAIEQTFQTHPPQPSETVAEAAIRALSECIEDMEAAGLNSPARAHAALRALKGGNHEPL